MSKETMLCLACSHLYHVSFDCYIYCCDYACFCSSWFTSLSCYLIAVAATTYMSCYFDCGTYCHDHACFCWLGSLPCCVISIVALIAAIMRAFVGLVHFHIMLLRLWHLLPRLCVLLLAWQLNVLFSRFLTLLVGGKRFFLTS